MNNKLLIISMITISLFLAGCSSETTVNEQTTSESIVESIETMSEAIASGEPTKCEIEYSDKEVGSSINIVYWLKGDNMRMESSIAGTSQVTIQKDKVMYMAATTMGIESDCKWISLDMTENMDDNDYEENADFDYTQYEDDTTYNIKCTPESFSDSKFDLAGKVCTMEELMGGMMEGLSFE